MKRKKYGVFGKAKKILKKHTWLPYRVITPAAFFTPAGMAVFIGGYMYLEGDKRLRSKSLRKVGRLI